MKSALLKLLALFCLATTVAAAAGSWPALRAGMDGAAVQRLVGPPVLATAGHGYIHWCYDDEGDAIFYGGALVFWTAPQNAGAVAVVSAAATRVAPAGGTSPGPVAAGQSGAGGTAGAADHGTGSNRPVADRRPLDSP